MELEKKKEYQIDDFMTRFNQYGKILSSNSKNEKNLNIALSSALRQLHENGEISLKYVSDKGSKWIYIRRKNRSTILLVQLFIRGLNNEYSNSKTTI